MRAKFKTENIKEKGIYFGEMANMKDSSRVDNFMAWELFFITIMVISTKETSRIMFLRAKGLTITTMDRGTKEIGKIIPKKGMELSITAMETNTKENL